MRGERWRAALELFERAVELPGDERAAFLERACAGDAELRAEVEELLAHDRAAPAGFVAPPPSHPAAHPVPAAGEGRLLGGFRLGAEIGRGATGVVYLARQESLGREAAVKVLAGDLASSESALERFHREARAAGKLDHPGIARVLMDGSDDGLHWIAMELVRGHDLGVELALQRGAQPAPGLSPLLPPPADPRHVAAAAALVADAAEALQHAHERGVVHRDVKPVNLLLTPQGQVKLVDFGIARDESLGTLTRTDQLMGSVPYMSPEQARVIQARVDHRTDVYSLGVVLYELLTLVRPFDGSTSHEVIARLKNREPRPVAALNRRVPRDLATVCGKAMAKAPAERYPSAGAFAADLRRFLRFEAVAARPPSPVRRALRRAHRHRVVLVTALLVLLALLAGAWAAAERGRRRTREVALEPLRALAAAADWDARGLAELVAARAALVELERDPGLDGEAQALLAGLAQRLQLLRRSWRERAESLVREGLAEASAGMGDGRGYDQVVAGVQGLQRLALLFPEDAALLETDVFRPRVSVRGRDAAGAALGGRVGWRRLDPITAVAGPPTEVGPLPVEDGVFPVGHVRVVVAVEGHGLREFTRFLAPGDRLAIEFSVRGDGRGPAGMVRVPAGVLELADDSLSPLVGRPVAVRPFWIDECEVSNADYRAFLAANPAHEEPRYLALVEPGSPADQHPVVDVSWRDARAYAEWAGKRLPSHAEWTLAARGEEGRRWPWAGDGAPGEEAYRGATRGPSLPRGEDREAWFAIYREHTAPVRSHAGARTADTGLYHALGNVSEWTESHVAERTPSGLTPRYDTRVACGSSWDAAERRADLTRIEHWGTGPDFRDMTRGFRCARSEGF